MKLFKDNQYISKIDSELIMLNKDALDEGMILVKFEVQFNGSVAEKELKQVLLLLGKERIIFDIDSGYRFILFVALSIVMFAVCSWLLYKFSFSFVDDLLFKDLNKKND